MIPSLFKIKILANLNWFVQLNYLVNAFVYALPKAAKCDSIFAIEAYKDVAKSTLKLMFLKVVKHIKISTTTAISFEENCFNLKKNDINGRNSLRAPFPSDQTQVTSAEIDSG